MSRLPLAMALACAIGCAGGGSGTFAPDAVAQVSVRVYAGLGVPSQPLRDPVVHLVLDVTSLSDGRGKLIATQEEQLAFARELTDRLLPGSVWSGPIELHRFDRFGEVGTTGCNEPNGPPRTAWAARAVGALGDRLRQGEPRPARVVLIGDLERECAVDLCDASRSVVEASAWLEVVALGSAKVPSCIDALRPPPGLPGALVSELTPPAPRFHIESAEPGAAGPQPRLAEGVANADPVSIPPGLVRVVLELEEAEPIGPFAVSAGDQVLVRVLHFPLSAPEERAWTVENRREP